MPSPAVRRTAGALVALALLLCACARPQPSPNVLLIVADDLGYNDLAINNGNAAIHTPSLDALAREGVRFTRHYADAVCSPARAALLTGQYAARVGYVPNGRGISPQVLTLAEALQAQGYATVHVGKWHIGDKLRAAWPDRQGFEHWFGFLNQFYLAGTHQDGVLVEDTPRHIDPWLMTDGDAGKRYPGHLDDILTERTEAYIRELGASGKPWFLNLWYYLPHAPITPAPRVAATYPDTPAGRYRAMVDQLDGNVGRVIRALRDTGQLDDTVIVFVSDNGGTAQELPGSNAPFQGAKTSFFEGGVRTPLLIRWPDGAGAGTVRDDVAAIQDIYPTVLAHLGISLPDGLDGRDLGIESAATEAPRELFWETYSTGHFGYSVLRDARWRLYKTWPWTPWEAPAVLLDTAADAGAPPDRAASEPRLLTDLEDARRRWQRDVHRPRLDFRREADGSGVLSGDDFLRTPGFGGFAFGIAMQPGYAGRIAEQQDIWRLAVHAQQRVTARFGDHTLQGSLPADGCRTVIVSGWFARKLSNWPGAMDHMALTLYLNGAAADSIAVEGKVDDANFAAPTLTGMPAQPQANALLSEPLLLSAPLAASDAWNPQELHRELCAAGPHSGLQTK